MLFRALFLLFACFVAVFNCAEARCEYFLRASGVIRSSQLESSLSELSPISATFQLTDDLTYLLGDRYEFTYDATLPVGSNSHFRTIDIASYELSSQGEANHSSHIPGGPYLVPNASDQLRASTNLIVEVERSEDANQTANSTPTRLTLSYSVLSDSGSIFDPKTTDELVFVRSWTDSDLKIALPGENNDREFYVVGLQVSLDQSRVENSLNAIKIEEMSETGANLLRFNEWNSKVFDNGAGFTLYLQDAQAGSNEVVVVDANLGLIEIYSTVPEPSTLLLLCTATIPTYLLRKRLVRARKSS